MLRPAHATTPLRCNSLSCGDGDGHRDVHSLSSRDAGDIRERPRHPGHHAARCQPVDAEERHAARLGYGLSGLLNLPDAVRRNASGVGTGGRSAGSIPAGRRGECHRAVAWAKGHQGTRRRRACRGSARWRSNAVAGSATCAWSFRSSCRPDGGFRSTTDFGRRRGPPSPALAYASRSTMTFMTGPPPSASCMPCWSSSSAMTRLSSGATSTAPLDTRPMACSQAARV